MQLCMERIKKSINQEKTFARGTIIRHSSNINLQDSHNPAAEIVIHISGDLGITKYIFLQALV